MGTVWVLDTETKGTGANMVPLERVLRKPASEADAVPVLRQPQSPIPKPPEPRTPRKFKVVDVMTREVLADGADTRATVKLIEDVRSIVDVTIWVWQPDAERWRMLTLEETRSLWEYRGRTDDAPARSGRAHVAHAVRSRRVPGRDARQPQAPPALAPVADHARGNRGRSR